MKKFPDSYLCITAHNAYKAVDKLKLSVFYIELDMHPNPQIYMNNQFTQFHNGIWFVVLIQIVLNIVRIPRKLFLVSAHEQLIKIQARLNSTDNVSRGSSFRAIVTFWANILWAWRRSYRKSRLFFTLGGFASYCHISVGTKNIAMFFWYRVLFPSQECLRE